MSRSEEILASGCYSIYVGVTPEGRRGLGWVFLGPGPNVDALLVSYGTNGPGTWREVGLDAEGNAVFRFPDGRFPLGDRGLFDPHTPPVSTGKPIPCRDFESAWSLPPIVPPSFRERIREYLARRSTSRDIPAR